MQIHALGFPRPPPHPLIYPMLHLLPIGASTGTWASSSALTITHLPCEDLENSGDRKEKEIRPLLLGHMGEFHKQHLFQSSHPCSIAMKWLSSMIGESPVLCKEKFNSPAKQPFPFHAGTTLCFEIWASSGQSTPPASPKYLWVLKSEIDLPRRGGETGCPPLYLWSTVLLDQ